MDSSTNKHKFIMVASALCALFLSAEFPSTYRAQSNGDTATPIKHVVVIFQENVSFDHYFGTYPNATNPPGQPKFVPSRNPIFPTPAVNGLTEALLTNNPNRDDSGQAVNPFRLDRPQQLTCDQNHDYMPEQQAYDAGLVDKFFQFAARDNSVRHTTPDCDITPFVGKNIVMGYYDGNTVTALWNYAQHFAMSDNSFSTVFGPSTPGAINLISGQTHGAVIDHDTGNANTQVVDGTLIGDARPFFEDCLPAGKNLVHLTGPNIGDLLNSRGITWGWFQGGFKPDSRNKDGTPVCSAKHTTLAGFTSGDYIPHHEPFQYYASTANPHHLPPTSPAMIGHTDQANHQYDLSDFWAAANSGNLPAVSFLKAAAYQDAHAENSDPLDEQVFLVNTINALESLPEWPSTAVIILYDDSDGWYDHVMPPIVNQSQSSADALTASGNCGTGTPAGGYQGRCGYGPRQPLLVVSRWARPNFVDHQVTDQSSVLRFIEDNWLGGERIGDHSFDAVAGKLDTMFNFGAGIHPLKLFLDPSTGER